MKLEIVRVKRANIPKITLDKKDYEKIGDIVEASILHNIEGQKQVTGSPIKTNAPSTIKAKRKRGVAIIRSLVDRKHRFVKGVKASWGSTATSSNVVIKPATHELATISRSVQMMGYTGWFGVSKKAKELIREIVRLRIKKIFQKAKSK